MPALQAAVSLLAGSSPGSRAQMGRENPGVAGNTLYYGDNLDILRRCVKDESVDLVYLDPPFNSNQEYTFLSAEKDSTRSAAPLKAFKDRWHWDKQAASAYQEVVEAGGKPAQTLQAFWQLLGPGDMLAYLSMMAPRLVELHRVLKPSGSIYLHCDPTAGYHLKVLMDALFGRQHFQNDIIWHYSGWNKPNPTYFMRRHDLIFYYSKGASPTFNSCSLPYASKQEYLAVRKQRVYLDEQGREYTVDAREGGKRQVRVYVDEALKRGKPADDVWEIDKLNHSSKERLGYPTQKPEALLERIIKASSNEGDMVLDPFCGCGTALTVAQRLKRRWIGIDSTRLAVALIKNRLRDTFGDEIATAYNIIGGPVSL